MVTPSRLSSPCLSLSEGDLNSRRRECIQMPYRALSRIFGSNDQAQPTQISIEMHPNMRRAVSRSVSRSRVRFSRCEQSDPATRTLVRYVSGSALVWGGQVASTWPLRGRLGPPLGPTRAQRHRPRHAHLQLRGTPAVAGEGSGVGGRAAEPVARRCGSHVTRCVRRRRGWSQPERS